MGNAWSFVEDCGYKFSSSECKQHWNNAASNMGDGFEYVKEIGGVIYDEAGNIYDKAGDYIYNKDDQKCFGQGSPLPIPNMFYHTVGPLATTCRLVNGLGTVGGWISLDDAGNWIDKNGTKYLDAGYDWVRDEAGGCYSKSGNFNSLYKTSNFASTTGKCIPGSNWVAGDIIPGGIEGITNFPGLDKSKLPDWVAAGVELGGSFIDGVYTLPADIIDKAADIIQGNEPFDECGWGLDWMPIPGYCDDDDKGGTFDHGYTGVIDQKLCDEMPSFKWDTTTNLCVLKDDISRDDSVWPKNFEDAIKQCGERLGEINITPSDAIPEGAIPAEGGGAADFVLGGIDLDEDDGRPAFMSASKDFSEFQVAGASTYNNRIGFSRFEDV